MKVNTWITGIDIWGNYTTDRPDGTLLGFDADQGNMVAYNSQLIPEWLYKKIIDEKI